MWTKGISFRSRLFRGDSGWEFGPSVTRFGESNLGEEEGNWGDAVASLSDAGVLGVTG